MIVCCICKKNIKQIPMQMCIFQNMYYIELTCHLKCLQGELYKNQVMVASEYYRKGLLGLAQEESPSTESTKMIIVSNCYGPSDRYRQGLLSLTFQSEELHKNESSTKVTMIVISRPLYRKDLLGLVYEFQN